MSKPKRNWKKCLGVTLGVLFLLYVVVGFFGVPLLLRHVGLRMLNDRLAGEVSVEAFYVNPFSYSLQMRGIEVRTPDHTRVFSAERMYGNFAFWSLFGKGWRFQEMHLGQPWLNVAVDGGGQLNLLQMLKPQERAEQAAASEQAAVAQQTAAAVAAEQTASAQEAWQAAEREPFILPLVKVDRLWVEDGGFELLLTLPGGEFRRQGKNINLDLSDFSSEPQSANPYAFVATTANGESVAVEGRLRLNPLSTRGTVTLEAVQLSDFDVFTADVVGVAIDSGSLSLGFDYLFSPVSEPHGLFLENGRIAVREVALSARDEKEPFAQLGLFEAGGFGIDLLEGSVQLKSLHVADASLKLVRDKDGLLNLIRYLFPQERQREIIEMVRVDAAASGGRLQEDIRLGVVADNQDLGVALTSAWQQVQTLLALSIKFNVDAILIENNTLNLRDEFLQSPVDFTISAIGLKATDVRNHGSEPFPFEFGLRTGGVQTQPDDRGALAVRGHFTPEGDKGDFNYELANLDLVPFAPYLASFTTAQLQSVKVGSQGQGSVSFPQAGLPQAALEFSAQVDALQVSDLADGQSVLAVEQVALSGARAQSDPVLFSAELLRIVKPALRIVRNKDGQMNLIMLVPMLEQKLSAQTAEANAQTAESNTTTADKGAKTPQAADKIGATAAAGTTVETPTAGKTANTAAAGSGASPQPAADSDQERLSAAERQAQMVAEAIEAAKHSQVAEALMATNLENISLQKLEIVDGTVTIIDEAVDPQVAFKIHNASLKVEGIVLKPDNLTTFAASARLGDGLAGVVSEISGEVVTLDPLKSARLDVVAEAITLATLGGYSEPVVGRPLNKGTLTGANLSYTIVDSNLKGENLIRMQDVGFAPRREQSTGPRLPLDMGLAILSDRNGAMRLDVPVSGNLKDPAFDLGRVIQYAIVNVLERLVTAPFAVLGSLLGSEADGDALATSVVFDAGSAEIPLGQYKGLSLLANALYQRPNLGLQLRPVTSNAADLQALREQLLAQRLAAYTELHKVTQAEAVEHFYNELVAALPTMDAQTRAQIEGMIAAAAARVAQAKGGANTVPPEQAQPVVAVEEVAQSAEATAVTEALIEDDPADSSETLSARSVVRARRGSGFLAVSETLQIPLEQTPAATGGKSVTDAAVAESAAAEGVATADQNAAVEQQVVSDQRMAAEQAQQAVVLSESLAKVELPLEDKRAILLVATSVTPDAIEGLDSARMEAIRKALETDTEHPLAPERIVFGAAWEANPQVPEQIDAPAVYFELGAN